ncbi:MAG TPA: ABATE domain-containing protein [Verrucomicrobiae bacterium]|nr:ABATE domain-containing protein [Verrucomicrobiae bacterium]
MDPHHQQPSEPAPKQFQFVGGDLSVDFCNTVGGKREGIPRENLHNYADFLNWCEQAGLVQKPERELLQSRALKEVDLAASVFSRAIALREALYRIFYALGNGSEPAAADIGILNSELSKTLGRLRLKQNVDSRQFEWMWSKAELELDSPLGPVAHSAANLLIDESARGKLHQCGGDNCGWLFLDCSKNHSRRWCDMRDCGNRAKVRRHRRKVAAQGTKGA